MPFTNKPQDVLGQISSSKTPFPIYILMGEEEYFCDKIEKIILTTYMPSEDDRSFDYTLLYGGSCSMEDILASCRRYPMMSKRTIVAVREAQSFVSAGAKPPISELVQLVKRPNPYNILVVNIKGGKRLNRTFSYVKELEKVALIVESARIRDYKIIPYIAPIASEHGLHLTTKALEMVANRIGTDLGRMDSELEKLATALTPQLRLNVTPEMVYEYTGWNKEYSAFDLRRALAYRRVQEAFAIVQALGDEEKRMPVQMILPQLFNYFANLLIAFYAPNRSSEQSVMKYLGITNNFFVKEYMAGLNNYKAVKVLNIIKYIRKLDARSRGMYSDEGSSEEILKDLVLFVFN